MENLIDKKFGRLIPIKQVGIDKWKNTKYLCRCSCGKEKIINGRDLKSGHTKSCGCLYKINKNSLKHGHRTLDKTSKTYQAWASMKQRCNSPNDPAYKYYGNRKIKVCNRWLKFENFLKDVGEISHGLTLDRINNNKGYNPKNFRLVTQKENNKNRRNSRLITFKGKTKSLMEWSIKYGINYSILWRRIYKYKWPIEKALTNSVQKGRKPNE